MHIELIAVEKIGFLNRIHTNRARLLIMENEIVISSSFKSFANLDAVFHYGRLSPNQCSSIFHDDMHSNDHGKNSRLASIRWSVATFSQFLVAKLKLSLILIPSFRDILAQENFRRCSRSDQIFSTI